MPRIITFTLIALIFLTACSPAATALPTEQPTATLPATAMPAPTSTATMTPTPELIAGTNGFATDADGQSFIYVESEGNWIALPEIGYGYEPKKVVWEAEEERWMMVDQYGNEKRFVLSVETGDWERVYRNGDKEYIYTSGVDPLAQERMYESFEREMGMSVEDYMADLIAKGEIDTGSGSPESGVLIQRGVFLGTVRLDLSGLEGYSPGDEGLVLMVASPEDPSVGVPLIYSYRKNGVTVEVMGWIDGRFDEEKSIDSRVRVKNLDDILERYNGGGGPRRGEVFDIEYLYFSGFEDLNDMTDANKDYFRRFLPGGVQLINDSTDAAAFLSRVKGLSMAEAAKALNQEDGDIGLFATAYIWWGESK